MPDVSFPKLKWSEASLGIGHQSMMLELKSHPQYAATSFKWDKDIGHAKKCRQCIDRPCKVQRGVTDGGFLLGVVTHAQSAQIGTVRYEGVGRNIEGIHSDQSNVAPMAGRRFPSREAKHNSAVMAVWGVPCDYSAIILIYRLGEIEALDA